MLWVIALNLNYTHKDLRSGNILKFHHTNIRDLVLIASEVLGVQPYTFVKWQVLTPKRHKHCNFMQRTA